MIDKQKNRSFPYHRRSIRLKGYDYSLVGAYFVTITVLNRLHLFGEVVNNSMSLSAYGKIAQEQWVRLQKRFPPSDFATFVIMPNHVHGIVHLSRGVGVKYDQFASKISPLRPYNIPNVIRGSLGAIVRAYKASVAFRINLILV